MIEIFSIIDGLTENTKRIFVKAPTEKLVAYVVDNSWNPWHKKGWGNGYIAVNFKESGKSKKQIAKLAKSIFSSCEVTAGYENLNAIINDEEYLDFQLSITQLKRRIL